MELEGAMQQRIITIAAGILGKSQRKVGVHALVVVEWLVAQTPEAQYCGQYYHANPQPVLQGKRGQPAPGTGQILRAQALEIAPIPPSWRITGSVLFGGNWYRGGYLIGGYLGAGK